MYSNSLVNSSVIKEKKREKAKGEIHINKDNIKSGEKKVR